MYKLLVIAFTADDATSCAGMAQTLDLPFDMLLLTGSGASHLGANQVLLASQPEIPPADSLAEGLMPFTKGYSHVAATSSMRAKDLLARMAGLLDAAMVTDVISVESPRRFKRPAYAGAVIETVETDSGPVLMTVRPAGFPPATRRDASDEKLVSLDLKPKSRRVAVKEDRASRPDLTQAKVIVSGGRPLRDAETFERVLGALADTLGGALGATRAAVDAGIAPNDLQVGQTGKIVAPDLYIAAGISGSTQHMAGIKDSKTIVAINKDPDAPIFEAADFGLVADLFDAVPALTKALGGP